MKSFGAGLLGAFLLAMTASSPLSADIINFDDIDASLGDVPVDGLSPYQGLNGANFSAYTSVPGFRSFKNAIVSSPNAAYTSGDALGAPIVSTITALLFDFTSAYLGSGWYDGLNVTLNGLLNDTQEFSRPVIVSTTGAQLFTFDFTDINDLDIFSTVTASTTDPFGCGASGCDAVTLDDLTLTPPPRPAS